jgi:hypothetical protein
MMHRRGYFLYITNLVFARVPFFLSRRGKTDQEPFVPRLVDDNGTTEANRRDSGSWSGKSLITANNNDNYYY